MNALMQRLETFTRLSQEDRAGLDQLSREAVREIGPRRDVIREGDRPRSVFMVLEGWACRYKSLQDGRRQIVGFCIPGDLCGLGAQILVEMDHSIASITRLTVAEVGRDDLERFGLRHPRVAHALSWDAHVALAIQREGALNLGQRTAFERLAHLLCELFLRLRAVGLTRGDRCDFPLTQVDLADATGLTAVHVNRTLQELRRSELIGLHGKTLAIPDLGALKSAALFNENYLHLNREGRHLDPNDLIGTGEA